MKNKLSTAISAAIPFIILSTPIHTTQADSVKLTEQAGLELSITANRRAQPIDKALAAVTIITRKDIDKSQAQTVIEVLKHAVGLSTKNDGGLGKTTSVFIRGTKSDHIVVLVDGIRYSSVTTGATAWQHLPLGQVDHIEIVRGPRSSLYGSEAVGGVIQIFTRKGSKGFKPSFSLSMGSHNGIKGEANFSGGNGSSWYQLGLERVTTDGIDACNSTTAGCYANDPDKDGYKRDSISFNVGHKNKKNSAELKFLKARGSTEFDGNSQDEAKFDETVIGVKLSSQLNSKLKLKFNVGRSYDKADNFKTGVFSSRFNTRRDTASLLSDIKLSNNENLLLGMDWYDDHVNTTSYMVKPRDNKGVFANYSYQLNSKSFDLALRQDDNEQYGKKVTGGVAIGKQLHNGVSLLASYGTAFKAPTFNQLYYPSYGVLTVKPEESKNVEFSVKRNLGENQWEVNLFENKITNMIPVYPVSNIDKARIRGLELSYKTEIAGLDISSNMTYLKAENRAGANKGKILRYRPEKTLNINLDKKINKWSIGPSVHAESKRFTNSDNSENLAGFATLALRTEYEVSKDFSIGLKVNNVLDKKHATNKGYNQDGTNGMLTLKYSPK